MRVDAGQSCVQAGHAYIATLAECEAAAAAIGLSDTSASRTSSWFYPRGCFVNVLGTMLYFSTYTTSTSTNRDVICEVVPGESPARSFFDRLHLDRVAPATRPRAPL